MAAPAVRSRRQGPVGWPSRSSGTGVNPGTSAVADPPAGRHSRRIGGPGPGRGEPLVHEERLRLAVTHDVGDLRGGEVPVDGGDIPAGLERGQVHLQRRRSRSAASTAMPSPALEAQCPQPVGELVDPGQQVSAVCWVPSGSIATIQSGFSWARRQKPSGPTAHLLANLPSVDHGPGWAPQPPANLNFSFISRAYQARHGAPYGTSERAPAGPRPNAAASTAGERRTGNRHGRRQHGPPGNQRTTPVRG